MLEFKELSDFFFSYINSYGGQNFYYDLHMHTPYSDGFIKPEFIRNFVSDKKYLISITDHNEIMGNIKTFEMGVNVVPGMELGCEDGFELLVYFKNHNDLEKFYKQEVEKYKNIKRMAKTHRNIFDYLRSLENYDCHLSIPHIAGVVQKNFIKNKDYIYDVIKLVDSIETHNNALPKKRNEIARDVRIEFDKTATFGSDAHIEREIISFYRYMNSELKKSQKMVDYLFKIGGIGGIGQKHMVHLLKNNKK